MCRVLRVQLLTFNPISAANAATATAAGAATVAVAIKASFPEGSETWGVRTLSNFHNRLETFLVSIRSMLRRVKTEYLRKNREKEQLASSSGRWTKDVVQAPGEEEVCGCENLCIRNNLRRFFPSLHDIIEKEYQ
jgi:hypothetical protein